MRISDWSSDVCSSDLLVRAALGADLADRLQERQGFDVAHGAADLHQPHVVTVGGGVDAALDLVGDVRDHLDGGAQVVAGALLADHVLVDLAGGDRVLARQPGVDEALVVAEVQVGLGAVVGDVHLAVLERRSEEHTSELQSLMRIQYAVFCLKKKKKKSYRQYKQEQQT